jgi:hypothetical protein
VIKRLVILLIGLMLATSAATRAAHAAPPSVAGFPAGSHTAYGSALPNQHLSCARDFVCQTITAYRILFWSSPSPRAWVLVAITFRDTAQWDLRDSAALVLGAAATELKGAQGGGRRILVRALSARVRSLMRHGPESRLGGDYNGAGGFFRWIWSRGMSR